MMLLQDAPPSTPVASPRSVSSEANEIALWVDDLITESQAFAGHNQRANTREALVCAVEIESKLRQWSASAFSRDISETGIGLITAVKVPVRMPAELSVQRFDGTAMKVAATCVWCKPYGPNWYASGWAFRALIGVRRF
ncbi:MAG: PilZ domain-containing protein [Planctomycetota bacterium]